VRIDRSKVAGGAERIPIATTIAACVGASLGRLFEGTNYEKGMHDLVQYVSRDAVHPSGSRIPGASSCSWSAAVRKRSREEELPEEVVDALQRRRGLRSYRSFDGARRSAASSRSPWHSTNHQLYVIARLAGASASVPVFRIRGSRSRGRHVQYPTRTATIPSASLPTAFGIFVEDKYAVERIEVSLARGGPRFVAQPRWHRSQESLRRRGASRRLR